VQSGGVFVHPHGALLGVQSGGVFVHPHGALLGSQSGGVFVHPQPLANSLTVRSRDVKPIDHLPGESSPNGQPSARDLAREPFNWPVEASSIASTSRA